MTQDGDHARETRHFTLSKEYEGEGAGEAEKRWYGIHNILIPSLQAQSCKTFPEYKIDRYTRLPELSFVHISSLFRSVDPSFFEMHPWQHGKEHVTLLHDYHRRQI
jgi:hypothetical protein